MNQRGKQNMEVLYASSISTNSVSKLHLSFAMTLVIQIQGLVVRWTVVGLGRMGK